jgi:TDG/mug DNA glycosylase family protein
MSEADHVLPDVLAPGLCVVFCGTAAGSASARAGAYYAGRGNRFWSTLHHVGLTPRELLPREFLTLPSFGLGLTDACKVAYGMDHEIAADAYNIEALEHAIATCAPRMLAFTSKRAAVAALGLRTTGQVAYGPQHRTIGGAPTWILPSPSGVAQRSWSVEPWSALAEAVTGRNPI